MDRTQPTSKDRSNDAGHGAGDRRASAARSGEGSASALATLKRIERDRERTMPKDDRGSKT